MYIDKYKNLRYNFFRWRFEVEVVYKISLALTFALLTGLLAQLRFFLPGTPVPVTGQVFGVILAGVMLGKWGGVSQCIYVGFGTVGLPWFAGLNGGIAYMMGPTGGYLIGFIIAAFFIGFIVDRYIRSRNFFGMLALMLFSTFVLIYIPGLIYFYLFFNAAFGLWELIIMCVLPFIAADLIKAIIAALIATGITPKKAYGREVDFR